MLMEALKPWINYDCEGVVDAGQRFHAHGQRAVYLELSGLAVPVIDEENPIKVIADPPPAPSAPPPQAEEPPPPPQAPAPPQARTKHDPKPVSKRRR